MTTRLISQYRNDVISFAGYKTGVYTLDVIVDDKRAYECIIAIGEHAQEVIIKEITKINNNNRVDVTVKTIFEKSKPNLHSAKICLFTPDHPICKPRDGKCPPNWGRNEDGQCFPLHIKCPPGYWRADDDETGACVPLPKEPSPIPVPLCAEGTIPDPAGSGECVIPTPEPAPIPEPAPNNTDPEPTPTPEPQGLVEEPEPSPEPEPLDRICGGQPCTATEKEDSWLSDEPETEQPDPEPEPEPELEDNEDIVGTSVEGSVDGSGGETG